MKLNRTFNQRKALIRTQLNALITHGQITTTISKVKLIKPLVDRLITKAKVGSVHARRQLAASLANVGSANRLVDVIAPLFADRVSGFTTSSKAKIQKGDGTTVSTLKFMADVPKVVEKVKEKVAKPTKPNASDKSSKSDSSTKTKK